MHSSPDGCRLSSVGLAYYIIYVWALSRGFIHHPPPLNRHLHTTHPQNPRVVCLLKKQYAAANPEGAIFVVESHVYPRGEQYNMSSQVYTRVYTTHIEIKYKLCLRN